MTWGFHPKAKDELRETIGYYEGHRPGLGVDFFREVQRAIHRIVENPGAWPIFREDTRRCQVNRFPYGIVYRVGPEGIRVFAVMHLRRDPDYWVKRNRD